MSEVKAEAFNLRQTWPRAAAARERGCAPASSADEAGSQRMPATVGATYATANFWPWIFDI
jgi:hypothetical protein